MLVIRHAMGWRVRDEFPTRAGCLRTGGSSCCLGPRHSRDDSGSGQCCLLHPPLASVSHPGGSALMDLQGGSPGSSEGPRHSIFLAGVAGERFWTWGPRLLGGSCVFGAPRVASYGIHEDTPVTGHAVPCLLEGGCGPRSLSSSCAVGL